MLSRFWHAGKRSKIIAAIGAGLTVLTTVAVVLALVLPWGAHADVVFGGDNLTPTALGTLDFGAVCSNSTVTKGFTFAISASGHDLVNDTPSPVFSGGASVDVRAVFVGNSQLSVAGTPLSSTPYPRSIGTIVMPANWPNEPDGSLSDVDPVSGDIIQSGAVTAQVTLAAGNAGTLNTALTFQTIHLQSGTSLSATVPVTATISDCNAPPPVITFSNGPTNISAVEATGPGGAAVSYTPPTATDSVYGPASVSCAPASGSTFGIGTTTVTCTATAGPSTALDTASTTFTVTVVDTTAPVLAIPGNFSAEATGPSGAAVPYSASATDLVDGSVPVTCAPASGSTFALGVTTVNCSASDHSGNTANGGFTITVVDTTPPALTLPADIVVPATSLSGAAVSYSTSAVDLVDGAVTPVCSQASGTTFPIGITTVSCTATDAHGNQSMGSFKVRVTYQVQGFLPPIVASPTAPTINWNSAKAGSTVKLSFQIFAGSDQVTDANAVQQPLTLTQVNCSTGNPGTVGSTTPGSGGLGQQGGSGKMVYSWATPQQSGACYLVTLYVQGGPAAVPGTSIQAYFQLR